MLAKLRKAFWLFGVTVFLLVIFLPGYTKLQELKDRNRDLENKIKRLNIENSLLEQEIGRIQSDPIYQERIAREKLGVVKKGVKIVPQER